MGMGGGVRIETARLVLRELREEDWEAVLAYQSDPRYLRYYAWESRSADEVRAFLAMLIGRQREVPRIKFQLAIELKADGRMIGNCGVRLPEAGSRVADIGYELAPWEWGQGYATEAARAVRDYGFEVLGAHRVWAECVAENVGSARVLEKIGLRLEGRLRESGFFKGRWWDGLIYGMLEGDPRP
jgi:[ribosomal protein S5]-alanine N-acetyltransferase